ncbi:MAG: zinc-binding alcohol dehydrogenase family protein [Terriglobia bacterium]
MKAVVLEKPGLLEMRNVNELDGRKPDEAVVRVRRVGICGTDLHAFRGNQPFFSYPRILGHELGVEVLEVENNNNELGPGDRCAVEPYLSCGHCIACRRGKPNCCVELKVLGVHLDGGMQEVLAVPVKKLHKSEGLSFDQLALTEMLGIGMHAVDRAELRADDVLLVVGAGPIGLAVIEFVRLAGQELTVMDLNEKRLAYCRDILKIERCIHAGHEPLRELRELHHGGLPTAVFDCTGSQESMTNAFRYVAHGGKLIYVGLFTGLVTFDDPFFHSHEMTLCSSRNSTGTEFERILRLIENGVIDVGRWITHRVPYTGVSEQLPQWLDCQDEFRKAIVEW